ncbi:GrpB family protein [Leptolyngbyaceae cyanobacterium UHCC 1019]
MKVEVIPYDLRWQDAFVAEAKKISVALGETIAAIHHIGSTAIPNIYAKPIIDILVEVNDLAQVEARNAAMEALGYEVMGEFGIAGRRYFRKHNAMGDRTHHVHIFEYGSPESDRHLAFRDYMIAHPEAAQHYSQLKRSLAAKFPNHRESYMDGKDSFIREKERQALKWRNTINCQH